MCGKCMHFQVESLKYLQETFNGTLGNIAQINFTVRPLQLSNCKYDYQRLELHTHVLTQKIILFSPAWRTNLFPMPCLLIRYENTLGLLETHVNDQHLLSTCIDGKLDRQNPYKFAAEDSGPGHLQLLLSLYAFENSKYPDKLESINKAYVCDCLAVTYPTASN